jgi:succinyl-diaminopimelate desuccinylase
MITGGTAPNTVPDSCKLSIDRRFLPGEDADAARAHIEQLLARLESEHGLESRLVERARYEASEVDEEEEIVRVVCDATETVTGRRPAIGGMPGSTDARFLAAAGIPTVIFGPGDVAQAHTTDESILLDDLANGALAYAATICRFLGVD